MAEKQGRVEHPLWWGFFMLVVCATFLYQFLTAPIQNRLVYAILGILVIASAVITLSIFNAILRQRINKQKS